MLAAVGCPFSHNEMAESLPYQIMQSGHPCLCASADRDRMAAATTAPTPPRKPKRRQTLRVTCAFLLKKIVPFLGIGG
jgi:hypothetical protein